MNTSQRWFSARPAMQAGVLAALLCAALGAGTVGAAAASLGQASGGLQTSGLGAVGSAAVDGVDAAMVELIPTLSGTTWVLQRIDVRGQGRNLVNGELVQLTLLNGSGAVLCEVSASASGSVAAVSAGQVSSACGALPIAQIRRVAVAVSGGA